MARNRRKRYKVTTELTIYLQWPLEEIGKQNLRNHIVDAVESWGGQRHPDDLLFDGVAKVVVGGILKENDYDGSA